MRGNNCKQEYPDGVWLPEDGSNGGCYHAVKCGAHCLKWVEDDEEIAQHIHEDELSPCSHCMEYHDLEPVFIVPPDLAIQQKHPDIFGEVAPEMHGTVPPILFNDLEDLYPKTTDMIADESDLIDLSYSYADTYEGDRAKVTETVYIEPRRAETVIGKLVFKLTHHSEKGRWEALKEDATRVEIERTVFSDD